MTDEPLERYESAEVELRLTTGEHVFGVLDAYAEDFLVLTGDGDPSGSGAGIAEGQRNYVDGEQSFNVDHVVSVEPMRDP